MRRYELMIILDAVLEERTVQPSLDRFLTVVKSRGGTVQKVDVWGRRRLAYDIDKKSEGIYAVVDLTADPDTVRELDRQLNLNEGVLSGTYKPVSNPNDRERPRWQQATPRLRSPAISSTIRNSAIPQTVRRWRASVSRPRHGFETTPPVSGRTATASS